MVAPNRQCVVNGHLVVVTLVAGKAEATVAIGTPAMGRGVTGRPKTVSIEAFLKAGLSEGQALEQVRAMVVIGLEGHEQGNG